MKYGTLFLTSLLFFGSEIASAQNDDLSAEAAALRELVAAAERAAELEKNPDYKTPEEEVQEALKNAVNPEPKPPAEQAPATEPAAQEEKTLEQKIAAQKRLLSIPAAKRTQTQRGTLKRLTAQIEADKAEGSQSLGNAVEKAIKDSAPAVDTAIETVTSESKPPASLPPIEDFKPLPTEKLVAPSVKAADIKSAVSETNAPTIEKVETNSQSSSAAAAAAAATTAAATPKPTASTPKPTASSPKPTATASKPTPTISKPKPSIKVEEEPVAIAKKAEPSADAPSKKGKKLGEILFPKRGGIFKKKKQ